MTPEQELYNKVMKVIKSGSNVEIRKGRDGELQIFEIKKNKVL